MSNTGYSIHEINSTLPSSAAVERLFSAAAQVIVTVTVYTELWNCLDDMRNITHSLGGGGATSDNIASGPRWYSYDDVSFYLYYGCCSLVLSVYNFDRRRLALCQR